MPPATRRLARAKTLVRCYIQLQKRRQRRRSRRFSFVKRHRGLQAIKRTLELQPLSPLASGGASLVSSDSSMCGSIGEDSDWLSQSSDEGLFSDDELVQEPDSKSESDSDAELSTDADDEESSKDDEPSKVPL